MKEEWKDVVGYKGYYQISNLGNMRSLDRPVRCRGKFRTCIGRLKKPTNINGYYKYRLSKNGKNDHEFAHRLVAKAFLKNPEHKPCVNHLDGNGLNNNITNLEWCTYAENEQHSYDVLGKIAGKPNLGNFSSRSFHSKATAQYSLKGKLLKIWPTARDAAFALNIQESNIARAISGRRRGAGGYKWARAH